MSSDIAELRRYLQAFDIESLMIDGLGWDTSNDASLKVTTQLQKYALKPVAQKAGFVIYTCNASDGLIPSYPERQKIEQNVSRSAFEHMIVFLDSAKDAQVWQWAKRDGKRVLYRHLRYDKGQTGVLLLQRLREIAFDLFDEPDILAVREIVTGTMDVETVTKNFYGRFKTEHATFQKFIKGMTNLDDKKLYASLMLNRMMFVYFFQKKGFLDNDTNYLRNRLERVKAKDGPDRFQKFYRLFLLRLFHEGLGRPERDRAPELAKLLGQVPYLNGGLFDVHKLEQDNTKISIPDRAFEKIFDFFDEYQWHLDWRPHKADNEINPDILGYIFEKHLDQKQTGAYYTQEDITGYISRNTIIPYLFSAVKKEYKDVLVSGSSAWNLLQDDPDNYIYPSVGHGIAWELQAAKTAQLEYSKELPRDIAVGIDDVSKREKWNKIAPPEYALPREIWRDVVERRGRYEEIKLRLKSGEIHDINDLVTLNLNVEKFAKDVILQSQDPTLIRAFWNVITSISILDPTCGSGAFLFAALGILEPLYATCLKKMQEFLDASKPEITKSDSNHLENYSYFQNILNNVEKHHSRKYYVLKSIIINNLYGVDIIKEAVEICKLRLFLKLVAQLERYDQIEPLPDIDFNIRTGNALVGFVSKEAVFDAMRHANTEQEKIVTPDDEKDMLRIDEEAKAADRAFVKFKDKQTRMNGGVRTAEKADLRRRLDTLRDELDYYLAKEYNIDINDHIKYEKWKCSHSPFHWFTEFYGIMAMGGFDVIIGNPPYLEFREVNYEMRGYVCLDTRAIHALCIERAISIVGKCGCVSMIVPIALTCTQRMKPVQDLLEKDDYDVRYANFSWRPSKLFAAVNRALTVFVMTPTTCPHSWSTGYQKWSSDSREQLFDLIKFVQVDRDRPSFWVPKLSSQLEYSILEKVMSVPTLVKHTLGKTDHHIFHRTTGGLYYKVFTNFAPAFSDGGTQRSSVTARKFSVQYKNQIRPLIASLSSDVFWWWYTIESNLRDLVPIDINNFPVPKSVFQDKRLCTLGSQFLADITKNSQMRVRDHKHTGKIKTQSFEIKKSKHIIDKIDRVLAEHYGFTKEELDFIINYDIKYRTSIG